MRPCWRLLALLLVGRSVHPDAAPAQSGFTGVVRLRSTVNARQDTIVQTTKGSRVRFDYLCDLVRSCTMIGNAGTHTMMIIEHDRRMFVTITQADGWQLEAMMQTLDPVLRTGRRPVSGLWDVSGLKFKKTRKSGEVAGQQCDVWVGRRPGASKDEGGEACLGTPGAGIAAGLLASVFSSETTVPPEYDESGLPRKALNSGLLRLRLVQDGARTTVEVISVEPGAVDDSLFDRPLGYEEVRMSDIIRWVAAQQQAERGGLSLSPRPGDFVSYPLPDDSRVSRPPSLTSCAWDSLAPGDYRGQGEVTYQVTPQGVADTATMTAVRLYGADPRIFRSAAQRVVAVCRFTSVAADTTASPILMRQWMKFAGTGAQYAPRDSEVYVPADVTAADTADMQHVTAVTCNPELHEEGVIRVQMVVGKDGLPEPGTISAVNETTHTGVGEAAIVFARCVFTPARYKGVPVRERIEFTVTVRYQQ